jgi:hypothetical protein
MGIQYHQLDEIEDFNICKKKFFLSHIAKIRSKNRMPGNSKYDIFEDVLNFFHSGHTKEETSKYFVERVGSISGNVKSFNFQCELMGKLFPPILSYIDYYQNGKFKHMPSLVHFGDPITVRGIDIKPTWAVTHGQKVVVVTFLKTQLEKNFIKSAMMHFKTNLLCALMRIELGESDLYPLKLVRIVKSSSLQLKKNETDKAYLKRVCDSYLEDPHKYFVEECSQARSWEIEQALQEYDMINLNILQRKEVCDGCRKNKNNEGNIGIFKKCKICPTWYRSTDKCTTYAGCEFLDLCRNPDDARPLYCRK